MFTRQEKAKLLLDRLMTGIEKLQNSTIAPDWEDIRSHRRFELKLANRFGHASQELESE